MRHSVVGPLVVVSMLAMGFAAILSVDEEEGQLMAGPEPGQPTLVEGVEATASTTAERLEGVVRADAPLMDLAAGRAAFSLLVRALPREADAFASGYIVEVAGDGVVVLRPAPDRDRGWGWHLYRPPSGTTRAVHVQIAHPVTDLGTPVLGGELFDAIEAERLTMAGASRRALDCRGDASHSEELPFDAVHRALLDQVDLVVQVHGFAADGHPTLDADVVVSPGPGEVAGLEGLAGALEDVGLRVCVPAPDQACDALAGRTNLQGASALEAGVPFVHLEVSDEVRSDDALRAALVGTVAAWIRSIT